MTDFTLLLVCFSIVGMWWMVPRIVRAIERIADALETISNDVDRIERRGP